jgi:hypothetical protein
LIIALVTIIGFSITACPQEDGGGGGSNEKVRPDTTGYTRLECNSSTETARRERTTVSPGQKFYVQGYFVTSAYNYSDWCMITSNQDCKVIIDFVDFDAGHLSLSLNSRGYASYIQAGKTINITAGDILGFDANSGKYMTNTNYFIYGFSIVAE